MSDLLGKIVIISHPLFNDRPVVALLTGETKAQVAVRYWKQDARTWGENEARRKKNAIEHVTGLTDEAQVAQLAEDLQQASRDLLRQEQAAHKAFNFKVSQLALYAGAEGTTAKEGQDA